MASRRRVMQHRWIIMFQFLFCPTPKPFLSVTHQSLPSVKHGTILFCSKFFNKLMGGKSSCYKALGRKRAANPLVWGQPASVRRCRNVRAEPHQHSRMRKNLRAKITSFAFAVEKHCSWEESIFVFQLESCACRYREGGVVSHSLFF